MCIRDRSGIATCALGLAVALLVSGIFSSVLEEYIMWVLPLCFFAVYMWQIVKSYVCVAWLRYIKWSLSFSIFLNVFLLAISMIFSRYDYVEIGKEWSSYGAGEAKIFIYQPNEEILGKYYVRAIRG